ncbi:hypothetical protein ACI2KT_05955 [Ensifer adhaerens]|uniref:hypothetical protein n=1 Tax=Ensifer adhaerens TaxID=106592 RepID=UPI00384D0147
MPDTASGTESPGVYARELARRFERIGIDAFASQNERYLVLLQDSPGEIIDLGKPLRGTRIFATQAARKNIPIVADFVAFARADGLRDCMFWCIGLPGCKATADGLTTALKAFNATINVEFSELRKRHSFEVLLIAIHPRFDHQTGLFDLHAHFVCRVPSDHREAVHRRLMTKFSRIDLRTTPIRNAAAVSTYMLWGIWRNKDMLTWPDHALQAAWSLTQHRFRLVRAGGAFAKWRSSHPTAAARTVSALDKETIQRNRRDTAYTRQPVQTGDRLLSKVKVRYGGSKVAALLFETQATVPFNAEDARKDRVPEYSSATIAVTQEAPSANESVIEERFEEPSGQKATTRPTTYAKYRFSKISAKVARAIRLIGKSVTTFAIGACKIIAFCGWEAKAQSRTESARRAGDIATTTGRDSSRPSFFRGTDDATSAVRSESSERTFGRLRSLALLMKKPKSRL